MVSAPAKSAVSRNAFAREIEQADGFFDNDYVGLGKSVANRFRADGDGAAIDSFFAKEVDDYFVGDDATRYTAVSFVAALTDDELKTLVKNNPEVAPTLKKALKGDPLHSYQLADFDKARVRFQKAVLETQLNSGWLAR